MIARQFFRAANSTSRVGCASTVLRTLQRSPVYRSTAALPRSLCTAKDTKDTPVKQDADKAGASHIPKYQLQPIDRFFLIVTGTMKAGDIPKEVSYEVLEKSQNRRRILINIVTIFFTFCGSIWAIRRGKSARDNKTEDNVFEQNVKRYEKLREQDRLEAEAEAKIP